MRYTVRRSEDSGDITGEEIRGHMRYTVRRSVDS